jgi:hypothetical protein
MAIPPRVALRQAADLQAHDLFGLHELAAALRSRGPDVLDGEADFDLEFGREVRKLPPGRAQAGACRLEVVDVMGKGTFAPDPFSEARFWVSRTNATRRPGRAGRALPRTTRRSRSGGWARG